MLLFLGFSTPCLSSNGRMFAVISYQSIYFWLWWKCLQIVSSWWCLPTTGSMSSALLSLSQLSVSSTITTTRVSEQSDTLHFCHSLLSYVLKYICWCHRSSASLCACITIKIICVTSETFYLASNADNNNLCALYLLDKHSHIQWNKKLKKRRCKVWMLHSYQLLTYSTRIFKVLVKN